MRGVGTTWRAVVSAAALVAVLLLTMGCPRREAARESGESLPAAADLLSAAAAELRAVQTVRFDISTSGAGEMLGITGAHGVVTRSGEAEGRARLARDVDSPEAEFVAVGDTAYVRVGGGDWRQVPLTTAAAVYDPTALLDPERGLAHLFATAHDARTEAYDPARAAYRVRATFDTRALTTLVPGINEKITGTMWIGDDRRLPQRIELPVRNQTGTITVDFVQFDEPVVIEPPR